jgi:xylulose-5-phosphate/fructose-6-phosphate phosphoketolase
MQLMRELLGITSTCTSSLRSALGSGRAAHGDEATTMTMTTTTRATLTGGPLSPAELDAIDAYWRAANYLSVGQIYLLDNPLLRQALTLEHIKPRLLGHWGTTPGLNFIYAHLNRAIRRHDLDMIFVAGPGHGGPGVVANTYLEGTYSELYPEVSRDADGLRRLFKQFSFPGGIPSHAAPETPGSINEGGELGYSLAHAFGAAFDNPDLIVACVVGDGEAETGPLATAWHSNKFLNPVTDGAVLPILHLNGYKIASPTLLARISREELESLFRGYGYEPYLVEGSEPGAMHQAMAATLEAVITAIRAIQADARAKGRVARPRWPMIILGTPKGWTGPKEVDGKKSEGSWRSHQVPLAEMGTRPEHVGLLEQWMKGYRPEELFDEAGALIPELAGLAPEGRRRMGANPHANGGVLLEDLTMPDFRDYAVAVPRPGVVPAEATRTLGGFLRDVMARNLERRNFRVFGPDETASNRLGALFEVTDRTWMADRIPDDEQLSPDGRVMEILSEHTCQGWLEGYLLTGRHGFFSCYEAFIHIVDSMFNQHAKWLKVTRQIPWRRPIASLNYLLTSHVWRQDHNGFSHQDPGFIDHVVNKKADVIRVYLPPDANTLLSVADHCLRSRNYVNVIVAGKQPSLQYLDMDAAVKHCAAGIGVWEWASNDRGAEPDVVMACAGDVPTLETLAAVSLLREYAPELKVRVINVVDLMRLQPAEAHPHGLSNRDFDTLFTTDKPIIFAYHGYPWLIHRLTYRRTNHGNLHVRGYKEEGTTTTPFDMAVRNDIDRFHLVKDVVDRVSRVGPRAAYLTQVIRDKLIDHNRYIRQYGEDMPEIRDWQWDAKEKGKNGSSHL